MLRIPRANTVTKDRRRQRTHPAKRRPELIATRPNEIWSWDIERHEALLNREGVQDPLHQLVAAGW
jgi:putative transposase